MKSTEFDALIRSREELPASKCTLSIQTLKIPVYLDPYSFQPEMEKGRIFVNLSLAEAADLKAGKACEILIPGKETIPVKGKILYPHTKKISARRHKKHVNFLAALYAREKEMVVVLAEEAGVRGITGEQIRNMTGVPEGALTRFSQDLEADGQIRVLSFSPLLIISRAKLDLLCSKVIDFLFKQHEKHPHEAGISTAQIQKRFLLHPRILALALTNLIRQKKLRKNADVVALSDFQQELTVDEKRQAASLEELYDKGQFQFESLENLQKSLGIPPGQMEKLVAYLVDQKKIVRAKDEFLLQASWLHDLVARVRSSSRKELTVREFKEITGLSRKYAVPLLELLDEMGVTRRKGAVREIVKDKLSDG